MSLPVTPKPRQTSARTPSVNVLEWLFRLLVVALLLGAFALVGWTFFRKLVPLQKQSSDLSVQVARLSAEVDEMERAWERNDPEQVSRNFRRVNSRLFSNEAALASWLTDLKEQVIPLALEAKADFGAAVLQNTNHQNLAVIPTTVSVGIPRDVEAIQSPYQRLLRLSYNLTSQERRVDLTELTVIGGTNSIQQATLVLNLWAGKERAE
jgi:hypothetical protein